jgi:hypothetical protein
MTPTASRITTTRIDKRTTFFIAHFVLDATYHAHGICEKYYLGENAAMLRRRKRPIGHEMELQTRLGNANKLDQWIKCKRARQERSR